MSSAAKAPAAAERRQARILVVDDERSMRELLAIVLRREGYEVLLAESGRAAIELLERQPVDILISDIKMPDVSGVDVLRAAKQIVWNLATNGLRAMPNGGRLKLIAAVDPASDLVVLTVQDEGVGISAEALDGLFQPFHGTFAKGSGLGLAIVHRIVTDYGGRVDVSSAPGQGTTFAVRFPSPFARISAPAAPPPVRSGAGSA